MEVVSTVRIKDDWRAFAEWELSLPGGHTVDAWSMARFAKCRIEFLDGHGCHASRRVTVWDDGEREIVYHNCEVKI